MSQAGHLLTLILAPCLAVPTIAGNGLVLFVILRPANRRRFYSPTNLLIASLAATDLLSGLLGTSSIVLQDMGIPHHYSACIPVLTVSVCLRNVSTFTFLLLTAERFIAVAAPFKYLTLMSTHRTKVLIAVDWLAALAFTLIMTCVNRGWNEAHMCSFHLIMNPYMLFYAAVCLQFIPLLAIAAMYVFICTVAIRHNQRIPNQSNVRRSDKQQHQQQVGEVEDKMDVNTKRKDTSIDDAAVRKPRMRIPKLATELKIAKRCFLMVFVFAICNLPAGISNTLRALCNINCVACQQSFVWLITLNSTLNPLLYAYGSSRPLRKEMRRTLLFWRE